jgi:hypothetical protein
MLEAAVMVDTESPLDLLLPSILPSLDQQQMTLLQFFRSGPNVLAMFLESSIT